MSSLLTIGVAVADKDLLDTKPNVDWLHNDRSRRSDMNYWMLQCNPAVWDVFTWWEESDGDLGSWTVSRHLDDIRANDNFAFWIGGKEAGVYGLGTIRS